jgi:serine/threonine protein kinase
MALQPGTRLGPYEVLSVIGAGGMGEVYRARDTRLERLVAVKVLAPELAGDAEFRARFTREARTISALSHPHIRGLYDIGREHDVDYLVLELLDGETLAARLTRGALPSPQVLRFGIEIADALERRRGRAAVESGRSRGGSFDSAAVNRRAVERRVERARNHSKRSRLNITACWFLSQCVSPGRAKRSLKRDPTWSTQPS